MSRIQWGQSGDRERRANASRSDGRGKPKSSIQSRGIPPTSPAWVAGGGRAAPGDSSSVEPPRQEPLPLRTASAAPLPGPAPRSLRERSAAATSCPLAVVLPRRTGRLCRWEKRGHHPPPGPNQLQLPRLYSRNPQRGSPRSRSKPAGLCPFPSRIECAGTMERSPWSIC